MPARRDYVKFPSQKTWIPRNQNVENLLIFYFGFNIVLTDYVRAKDHKNKYSKATKYPKGLKYIIKNISPPLKFWDGVAVLWNTQL